MPGADARRPWVRGAAEYGVRCAGQRGTGQRLKLVCYCTSSTALYQTQGSSVKTEYVPHALYRKQAKVLLAKVDLTNMLTQSASQLETHRNTKQTDAQHRHRD